MFVELILLAMARIIGTPVNGAYGWISVGPLTISASGVFEDYHRPGTWPWSSLKSKKKFNDMITKR